MPATLMTAHEALAGLLCYPVKGLTEPVAQAVASLAVACPPASERLREFAEFVAVTPQHDLEELFTRTFANVADRALEIGWHLHGETYDRGAFLVVMRGRLRDLGITENSELPDHLSHGLIVLIACLLAGISTSAAPYSLTELLTGSHSQPQAKSRPNYQPSLLSFSIVIL